MKKLSYEIVSNALQSEALPRIADSDEWKKLDEEQKTIEQKLFSLHAPESASLVKQLQSIVAENGGLESVSHLIHGMKIVKAIDFAIKNPLEVL